MLFSSQSLLSATIFIASVSSTANSPCELACAAISATIPHAFFLRGAGVNTLWDAKQSDLIPACRIEPSTPEEVSTILKSAIKDQCHFAVRGGGHSRIAGSSNAEDGITIDLKNFKFVEVADDKKTVRIGGGSVWGDVYRTLEAQNLMVVGGRVSDVGVGGLILGGMTAIPSRLTLADPPRWNIILLKSTWMGERLGDRI